MQNLKTVKLVATDLDGTFLDNDRKISEKNKESLEVLGEKNILRVIATGRNFSKTREVIPEHIPFDYIVFSSGAGVYDCKQKKVIHRQNISSKTINGISKFLFKKDLGFHLFKTIPQNHYSLVYTNEKPNKEFLAYTEFHQSYSQAIPKGFLAGIDACQFLVILEGDVKRFEELRAEISEQFSEIKIVRTSSPLNTGYIWMEIFHKSVSKGNGVRFLCDLFNIDHGHTVGIGNDYNDLELLDFTGFSYIVENAPEDLKKLYSLTSSNEENAFHNSLKKHL